MSFFRKKQVNRRLGRVHVLDVRLRSDQVRKSRMRFVALSLGSVIGLVIGVYACWRGGEWVLNRVAYENPAFAISSIEAQTDGVIVPDQLRRWANVRPGENLLALDIARVKRDLEMVPMIATVSVERILPKTLRIRVTEREPVAQVNVLRPNGRGGVEATVFHLDAAGFVIVPLDPRQRTRPLVQGDDSLPLLMGLKPGDLQPGRAVESPAVQAALKLAAEFAYSPMAGLVDLKRIDVSAPDVLVVKTGQGSEVTFGLENLDQQLRRWREVHELGLRMRRNLASLDLAVSNNVPARWIEASVTPPPAKIPKTLRNRRRNV
ncbi:MAG: FtsQ-type POTRA domain-containing protein [Verrucomicrobiales bacterium]|nr:MAG: FtsQ-type POTRA domain-containing protein [Verrucomicrobiales bacterium]